MPKRNAHGKVLTRKAFNKKQHSERTTDRKGKDNLNTKSTTSSNPYRKLDSGKEEKGGFYRERSKIKLLKLYTEKVNVRKMRIEPSKPNRIEPDRRWFGNTRVIDQRKLEKLREEVEEEKSNTYTITINSKKLPMSLLSNPGGNAKMNILDIEPFKQTFGPRAQRKKPKLTEYSLDSLKAKAEVGEVEYNLENDSNIVREEEAKLCKDKRLEAGQSRRIWEELYKVVDASDVIIQVLDARDPIGTRATHVEAHLKKNCPSKHIILVLNKCDLIPIWLTVKWVKLLSREYPTLAFRASVSKPFGKGALIQLLRQFDNLHKSKKNISIGFIGYPNVGKSSVINTIKRKSVCKVAPIPGETKVWQYITLTKRIYLIDCPGIVEGKNESVGSRVLKGVLRAENLADPEQYIEDLLERAERSEISKSYDIHGWSSSQHFLHMLAQRFGKLKKGGEPNTNAIAKILINDWQRGKIHYYVLPTKEQEDREEIVQKHVEGVTQVFQDIANLHLDEEGGGGEEGNIQQLGDNIGDHAPHVNYD